MQKHFLRVEKLNQMANSRCHFGARKIKQKLAIEGFLKTQKRKKKKTFFLLFFVDMKIYLKAYTCKRSEGNCVVNLAVARRILLFFLNVSFICLCPIKFIGQSISKTVSQPAHNSFSHTISQLVNQTSIHSGSQSVSQSTWQSAINQSGHPITSHLVSQ